MSFIGLSILAEKEPFQLESVDQSIRLPIEPHFEHDQQHSEIEDPDSQSEEGWPLDEELQFDQRNQPSADLQWIQNVLTKHEGG